VPRAEAAAGGEFSLIRRYFSSLDSGDGVLLGVGDDAAELALPAGSNLLISTDTQLEGRHFPAGAAPDQVAFRAVAAAASDLAAMGAAPLAMTLALSIPDAGADLLAGLERGVREAAQRFGLPLVGGDTVRGSLALTVTVLGHCAPGTALRRDGARPGDQLCLSGPVGAAAAGLAVLQGELAVADNVLRDSLLQAFWRPLPQLALGQRLRGVATAAIDVSDGLLADAGHIAAASGVRLHIDVDRLPLAAALREAVDREQALRWALSGGDDYQLCFTLPAEAALPEGCVAIGVAGAGQGVAVSEAFADLAGFEHF
jgi:thiamine-monophosphate kinase